MREVAPGGTSPPVSLRNLATGFAKMGLFSFGGGLTAWARRVAVDERRWFDDDQFLEALAVCQILPGPNTINLAVYLGARLRGLRGSLAALGGLILIPLVIVVGLGMAYFHAGAMPGLQAVLKGMGACAAGMAFSMGAKLCAKRLKDPVFLAFGLAAFVLVGLLRWSMFPVVLALGPLAVLAYRSIAHRATRAVP